MVFCILAVDMANVSFPVGKFRRAFLSHGLEDHNQKLFETARYQINIDKMVFFEVQKINLIIDP